MPNTFEYNVTRPLTSDFRDTEDAQRKFYTDTRDPTIAQSIVDQQFGGKNSPFPGRAGLVVDRVEVAPAPDGIGCDVTYVYTNDRSGGSSFRYRKSPGFLGYRESTISTRTPVPSAGFTQVIQPRPNQSSLVANLWYRILPVDTIPSTRSRFEIEVVVIGWGSDKSKLISAQVDKVHTIGGRKLLYEGANVTQQIPTDKPTTIEYNVRHAWVCDDGTPKFDPASYDSTFVRLPDIDRDPFTEWVLKDIAGPKLPSATNFGDFFAYSLKPLYKADPLGWKNLPGVPNL